MRRRFRLLRVAKWGGVVMCVLLAAAWVGSVIWWIGYLPAVDDGLRFHINHGRIHVGIGAAAYNPGWRAYALDIVGWGLVWPSVNQIVYAPRSTNVFPRSNITRVTRIITIPFWLCFAVVLIPTVILVWIDRRRSLPGHCPCGYDLTGNVSGVCPECGREFPGPVRVGRI